MPAPWEKQYRTVDVPTMPGAGEAGSAETPTDPITLKSMIDAITGSTSTQKAVTGATMAADVARLVGLLPNPATRVAAAALPIAVGAASEYLQGGSPISGATTGALQSVVPNLLARGTGAVLRQRKDVKELTNAVKEHLPVLASELDRNVTTWDKLFRGGRGAKIAGDALNATKNKVAGALGIKGEVFPLLSSVNEKQLEKEWGQQQPLAMFTDDLRKTAREMSAASNARPFDAWDREITRLNRAADRFATEHKSARAAGLRQQAYEMTEELIQRIRDVDPALAEEYAQSRHQMHDTLNLKRLLSKKGVITTGLTGNRIDMGRLQELLNVPGFREAFESSPMGRRFLEEAFRGGPPIGGDVPHKFGVRFFGHPSLQHALPMGGLSGHPSLGGHVGRRIPIPATPFEFLQNYIFSGSSGNQE